MPNLLKQIYDAGTPRETQSDVSSYYRQEYPGQKTNKKGVTTYEWQGRLSDDLSNVLGVKRASIMRRFQKGRKDKEVSKKHADEYEALGAMLPPKPPAGGYHITGTIWFKYADQPCEDREVDEIITGSQAKELANMAYEDMLQSVLNSYMSNDGQGNNNIHKDEPMLAVSSECEESNLTVEAIEE
jgi:hypothetical protein